MRRPGWWLLDRRFVFSVLALEDARPTLSQTDSSRAARPLATDDALVRDRVARATRRGVNVGFERRRWSCTIGGAVGSIVGLGAWVIRPRHRGGGHLAAVTCCSWLRTSLAETSWLSWSTGSTSQVSPAWLRSAPTWTDRGARLSVMEQGREVVVLGAGFSKAVHEAFPLIGELAEKVADKLAEQGVNHPLLRELKERLKAEQAQCVESTPEDTTTSEGSLTFETWLSRLAEDQPHLDASERFERRALFSKTARSIREVLVEAEEQAFRDTLPSWAFQFVRLLDIRQATVLTLNYDLLAERLTDTAVWVPARPSRHAVILPGRKLLPEDIFCGLPPCSPPHMWQQTNYGITQPLIVTDEPVSSFRLLKLHGSIGWFAVADDPTGLSLAHWRDANAEKSEEEREQQRRQVLPGREPFIVPPATNKSGYLANPVVREIWWSARHALETARRVVLVGYSLPLADATFAGLLAETLSSRGANEQSIEVVDVRPEPVVKHLARLGIRTDRDNAHEGGDALEGWVASQVDDQAKDVVKALSDTLSRMPDNVNLVAMAHWKPERDGTGPPVQLPGRMEDNTLVLEVQPPNLPTAAKPTTVPEFRRLLSKASKLEVCRILRNEKRARRPIVRATVPPRLEARNRTVVVNLYPMTTPEDWS